MDIARRLAAATRRKDFQPNVDLAIEIVDGWDDEALAEIFALVDHGSRRQAHDAIHVAFEVAQRAPELVVPHVDELFELLTVQDNRLLWGALSALSSLVHLLPARFYEQLDFILAAAARSSIVGRFKTLTILTGLMQTESYTKRVTPLLLAHVQAAATNQFPTYAAAAAECLKVADLPALARLIRARRDIAAFPAKQKHMDRLLARIAKVCD